MRRRGEILVLALAALLAALAVRSRIDAEQVPPWLLPVDDAYIFVRYAQQAAEGRPLQWNPGEASTGATDPAFTLLLLPGQWLFDDLAGWSRWSLLVGVICLAGLGLAARSLLAALLARPGPAYDPWPLTAGLAVIGGGPFAYFSVGGMDNAFASAMLLGALAGVTASGGRKGLAWVALLPWVRPDFAVVVAVSALLLVLGKLRRQDPRSRRLTAAALLFVPGLALMALNLALTGHASPGGALAKSVFSDPFQTPGAAWSAVAKQLTEQIVPVYAGLRPTILPPPVGVVALLVVGWVLRTIWRGTAREGERRDLAHRLLLPVLAWTGLVAVAVTSGYLWWQRLRHHHPGLALAWVFAFLAMAVVAERWRSRRISARAVGAVALIAGLLPWLGLVEVSRDHAAATRSFYGWNFRTAAWLQQHVKSVEPPPVVAMHDAGLFSLAADGPAVDLMGLGTTELALPYRDGVGALVEHLARRRPLPELAVGRRALLRLGPLLGEEIFASPRGAPNAMVVAPIRTDLLRDTALDGPGIDFGYLPSERQVEMRWSPPPPPSGASLGTVMDHGMIHGCRPLYGSLRMSWPDAGSTEGRMRLVFTAVPAAQGPATVRISAGGGQGSDTAVAGEAGVVEVQASAYLLLERQGDGLPCLESLEQLPPSRRGATLD